MAACLLIFAAGGCQLAYFLTPEQQKPVKAEYARMADKKVAVIVWADQTTLDFDRRARRRVCDAVVYDLKKHLPAARFVEARAIEQLQQEGPWWETLGNAELCKRLGADLIVRIDLLTYTTRAADTKELRKGRVQGTVNVYECGAEASADAAYQTEVTATYPSAKDSSVNELGDSELLRATVSAFGQAVGRKFYDHEVSYRGPPGV
jgi:hypothetical protein